MSTGFVYVVSLCAGDNSEGGALSPGVPARLVSSGHGHVQQFDCDRWPVGPCRQLSAVRSCVRLARRELLAGS